MLLYLRLIFQFSSFDLPVIVTKEHLSEISRQFLCSLQFFLVTCQSRRLIDQWERKSSRAFLIKAVSLVRKDRPLVSKTRTRFPNTKLCARLNQRHFGSKKWQPSSFHFQFQRECSSGGNMLSTVRSFIILRSTRRGFSQFFNENNHANSSGEKKLKRKQKQKKVK